MLIADFDFGMAGDDLEGPGIDELCHCFLGASGCSVRLGWRRRGGVTARDGGGGDEDEFRFRFFQLGDDDSEIGLVFFFGVFGIPVAEVE